MLSQRTRYTIRALLHLADRYGEGPVQLAEIADVQHIPPKFLTVMLSSMRRAGLVESMRGREGGYWLARPPAEISYGEIVRRTRGSLGLLPCASRLAYRKCDHCVRDEAQCRLRRAMLMVRDETARILDGLTLADQVHIEDDMVFPIIAAVPDAATEEPFLEEDPGEPTEAAEASRPLSRRAG